MFKAISESEHSLTALEKNIRYFQNAENIPRTFAKQLRNTYPLGELQVGGLNSFLKSRNHRMPDGTNDMYRNNSNNDKVARWYDALEIMELYAEEKEEC